MRLLLSAVFVLVAATGVGANHAEAKGRLVAFGDSYVNPGHKGMYHGLRPWVTRRGARVVTRGPPGERGAATLARARRAGSSFDQVVVEVGINDVRRAGDDSVQLALFGQDYEALLDRLSSARRVVVVPPLPILSWGPYGSEAALLTHRSIELQLAAAHPNVVVADPIAEWRPETMLLSDRLHPNAAGRTLIAETVRAALTS